MSSFVLIDNDELIRMSWQMSAQKSKQSLFVFSNTQDFVLESSKFSKQTTIYIDYELDDNKNGLEESKSLFDLGFKSIYLATGYTASTIKLPEHIIGIVGKRPPF